jgi:hypothetical protein
MLSKKLKHTGTGSGAHPASYSMGTERGKARPGRDVDHSPPSSAEVKNEQELYLLPPHVPPWHVAGLFYFFFLLSETFKVDAIRSFPPTMYSEK